MNIQERKKYQISLQILDSIEMIKNNKNLIKPSEHEILSPSNLARLILRRLLKQQFNSFDIRKNKYEYSLRCEDENLYKLFLTCHLIKIFNIYCLFTDSLMSKIQQEGLTQDDFTIMQNAGINYKFKDNDRLFFYINFLPLKGKVISRQPEETILNMFVCSSFYFRTNKMKQFANRIKQLNLDIELCEKINKFMKVYPKYQIIHLPEKSISEDFLTYCLRPDVMCSCSLNVIYREYLKSKKNVQNLEESEDNELPSGILLSAKNNNQDDLQETGVTGIRLRRTSVETETRNFNLEESTIIQNESKLNKNISIESAIQYLNYIDANEKEPILKISNIDIYDDIDNDKTGLYFSYNKGKIIYYIFDNDKIIYQNNVLQLAVNFFTKTFNKKPKELKYYSEKIKNIENKSTLYNIPF